MTKRILTFILILSFILIGILYTTSGQAQMASPQKNAQSFYGELGGPGIITVNYEYRFNGQQGFAARIGMGGYGFGKKGVFTVPAGVNYITGSGKHFAEVGAGICGVALSGGNTYFDNEKSGITGYFNFGYRYQPENNGMTYRAFLSPLFTPAGLVPFYAGFSVGLKF
jgi:hypothetical protein